VNYEPIDIEKGLEYYKKATELKPEIASIHISLGDIYTAINEKEMATLEYSKAITNNPESWVNYMQNAHAKSCLGLFKESRTDYQTARDLSYPDDVGYVMEALTYAYEGSPETCLKLLEEKTTNIDALDINDTRKRAIKYGCATASGWIALYFSKPDHFSQAKIVRNQINNVLVNTINDPDFTMEVKVDNLFWEGLEAAIKGYYDAAIVKACDIKIMLRESNTLDNLSKYHFLYGYAMYRQGRYGKAIEHFEQGDHNWVYNKYQLAKAYDANGESDIADVLFKEVAAYNNNDIEYAIIRNEVKDNLASK
jgi:tetratricopeptide (TPR) repeat protein